MNHPAASELDPAGAFARTAADAVTFEPRKIKFSARFSKWEIGWAEPGLCARSIHLPQKLADRPLQVGHGDTAINTKTLDLKEHGIMGCIRSIAAEYTTRGDHSNRDAAPFHCMDLHGRSL